MLSKLENALVATGIPVAHYGWAPAPSTHYIVWAEDGAETLHADRSTAEEIAEGTVDLFTLDPADKAPVVNALNLSGFWWQLESVQYEEETRLIHFEWTWRDC